MDQTQRVRGSVSGPAAVLAGAVLAGLLSGCSAGARTVGRPEVHRLSPSDFAAEGVPSRPSSDAGAAGESTESSPRVMTAREARGGDRDVLTLVGRPADLQFRAPDAPPSSGSNAGEPFPASEAPGGIGDPRTAGSAIVIDEMVGQINGRPVYAAEFLTTLDDILRAEAMEKSRAEWMQIASRLIQNQLLERIRDELLIAEFNAELTYEERIGLFAFIDQIQQGIVDRDLGSAARADERLRAQENVSLRGKAQEQFNREVVFEQLRREVTRKVQVSWRDIQRYYDQNITIFQPPSTARLRVLRVDAAERERVEQQLQGGADLAGTISRETTFRSRDGGLIEMELGPGGIADAEFFGPAELNDPATQLAPGELSEPIAFNDSLWWLYLEEVVEPERVTLYEAQNRIEQMIRSEREQQERARYFERLFGSSTMTEQQLAEMRDRLIEFAVERYLQPEEPAGRG